MTIELSRRGLFQGLRGTGQVTSRTDEAGMVAQVARISDRCVEPKGVVCRRCADECDVRAISFRLLGAGRAHPLLDLETCTGCSACLAVCPTQAIELIARERGALLAGLAEYGAGS